jgi:hypothetical protein
MERKDGPFLRQVAETISENDEEANRNHEFYIEQGAQYLERPHRDNDIGVDFPLREREQVDTTQPHGKLRSLIRSVIEGRNES